MFCRRICSSGGIEARCWATTLSCCATSSADAVPTSKRCLIRLNTRRGGGEIVARDAQPVVRGEHLEIGIGDADDRGERHHLAVEAARDRGLLGGAQRRAVLAPEVDLVARAERGAVDRARRAAATAAVPTRCCRWWSARRANACAGPFRSTIGSSAAPAMRDCASACTMRATAAAMSKLEVSASSIRSVSSLERKPRHHTHRRQRRVRHCAALRDRPAECRWRRRMISPDRQPPSGSANASDRCPPRRDAGRDHDNTGRCDSDRRIRTAQTHDVRTNCGRRRAAPKKPSNQCEAAQSK